METKKKQTKTAKAIFDLYKAMPDAVQKEVKTMILLTEKTKISVTNELTMAADESFADIWNTPENDHWDDFFETSQNN